MYLIRKKFEIDAGHRLMQNRGKCRNLHGHRYAIEVELSHNFLDKEDMVLDFFELKWLKVWLDDNWDHGMILNENDGQVIRFCEFQVFKIFKFPGDPTAENMSAFLYKLVAAELESRKVAVTVSRIIVHETPNCVAEYIPNKA